MRRLMLAVLVALLPAAAPADAAPADAAPAADVTVSQPWMRFLLPSLPASGYMVLQNNSDTAETLTNAASPACGSLMLHESEDTSGMAMMMAVPNVPIPAHGSVAFAPGGYHLMCMNPNMKIGGHVRVTLTLQPGGAVTYLAPVYGATTAP